MSRKKRKPSRPRRPRPRKARSRPAASPAEAGPGLKRWSRLLTKVDRDPESALDDPRCLKPRFLAELFDLCDGKALEAPYVAPDYAEVAVELASRTGDRHLMNLAAGVAAHAEIGNEHWDQAARLLDDYRQHAFGCCRICTSDWLKRHGDLLVETRDPIRARSFLELSVKVLGSDLDADTRGRIVFVRGIAHLYLGARDRALADAGDALRLLSLSTPRGYFLDTVAFLGCFLLGGAEPRHDQAALDHLAAFRQRLKGQKSWDEVRDRIRWVEGLLLARLGHPRRARARLERAWKAHVRRAPHHWALALAVDHALVYCRHMPEAHSYAIGKILKACKTRLKLEPKLRRRLVQTATDLGRQPQLARQILSKLRQSYVVPVPGLLASGATKASQNQTPAMVAEPGRP
jgi:hypothetical protein